MAEMSDALVQELLSGRFIGCLGTHNDDNSMQLTAVWYLFDGTSIYVATSSQTRKARNVTARPTASFMVDSRDPVASRGICCSGKVELLAGGASREMNRRIHERYLSE